MGFFFGSGFFEIFGIIFILFIVLFLVILVRGIGEWNSNNHSPQLTVEAVVVSKRTKVSGASANHISTSTQYYVTFQVESGDRMEFHVNGRAYGMLAEGDRGQLRFQGTRYLDFERQMY